MRTNNEKGFLRPLGEAEFNLADEIKTRYYKELMDMVQNKIDNRLDPQTLENIREELSSYAFQTCNASALTIEEVVYHIINELVFIYFGDWKDMCVEEYENRANQIRENRNIDDREVSMIMLNGVLDEDVKDILNRVNSYLHDTQKVHVHSEDEVDKMSVEERREIIADIMEAYNNHEVGNYAKALIRKNEMEEDGEDIIAVPIRMDQGEITLLVTAEFVDEYRI